MIWQFDNSQVYVLGSVHLMKRDDNYHLRAIKGVYNKVSKVVFEASQEVAKHPITMYENDKLSNHISKSLFRDTKKSWIKYGFELSELEKTKVWQTTNLISSSILKKNGFLPEHGIDQIIHYESKKDNKEIEWLEPQYTALSYADNAPMEEQYRALVKAVRNPKTIISEMTSIVESWNAGNEKNLLHILNSALDESPEQLRNLIFERNSQWIKKFTSALNSNVPTLFVVGALHCIGRNSIQNIILENHGYTSKAIIPK
jgi:uncharacterized protein YbaP (TraB family)